MYIRRGGIMGESKGFGYCGLACDYCQDNEDCVGCKQGGCSEKDVCKNYQCCVSQNYKYCFECHDFPCNDSILHKLRIRTFCQYIQTKKSFFFEFFSLFS